MRCFSAQGLVPPQARSHSVQGLTQRRVCLEGFEVPLGMGVRAVWGFSALLRLQAALTIALEHEAARGVRGFCASGSSPERLAAPTLSQFLCHWGPPALAPSSPPSPGVPVHVRDRMRGAEGGRWEPPTAPLRNPQPAPETSSRSQQEPADLAAASEGGGMEGGRKPARDQNEITARERDGWWSSRGEREGGVQQSRACRGSHPWVPPWNS